MISNNGRDQCVLSNDPLTDNVRIVVRNGLLCFLGRDLFGIYLKDIVIYPRGFGRILRRATNDAQDERGLRRRFVNLYVYLPNVRMFLLFVHVQDRCALFCEGNNERLRM